MRLAEVGAPVAATHGNDAQLRNDDGRADGSGHFLGRLDTETNVALRVTDDDDRLESGSLTGTGLLLDGLDLFTGELLVIVHPTFSHFDTAEASISSALFKQNKKL